MADPAVLLDWALRIVMGGVSILVLLWGRERGLSDKVMASEFALRDQRLRAIEHRLEDGNERMSSLTSKMQPLFLLADRIQADRDLAEERIKSLDRRVTACEERLP